MLDAGCEKLKIPIFKKLYVLFSIFYQQSGLFESLYSKHFLIHLVYAFAKADFSYKHKSLENAIVKTKGSFRAS